MWKANKDAIIYTHSIGDLETNGVSSHADWKEHSYTLPFGKVTKLQEQSSFLLDPQYDVPVTFSHVFSLSFTQSNDTKRTFKSFSGQNDCIQQSILKTTYSSHDYLMELQRLQATITPWENLWYLDHKSDDEKELSCVCTVYRPV